MFHRLLLTIAIVVCFAGNGFSAEAVAPVADSVPVVVPPSVTPTTGTTDTAAAEDLGLSRKELRDLGFTRSAARRATLKAALHGELSSTVGLSGDELEAVEKDNREVIAAQIQLDHAEAWQTLKSKISADDGGRDWEAFFDALAEFLIKIQPFIEFLISLFAGIT